jgi:hypothetical protein
MTLLTEEQRLVVYAAHNVRRLKVEALAGTGKTTVLIEVAKSLKTHDPTKRILYTAFNKLVVDEVGDRIRRFADSTTVHGLAMKTVGVEFVGNKLKNNPRRLRPAEAARRLGIVSSHAFRSIKFESVDVRIATDLELTPAQQFRLIRRCLLSFTRSPDKLILPKHVDEAWWSKRHETRFRIPDDVRQKICHHAEELWRIVTQPETTVFEFLHDYYMKMWHLTSPQLPYDTILFDEAQDADPLMRDVVEGHDGQVIWCGDRHQSIYSWRGAVNAMQEVEADYTLYLTQSFRFGDAIANVANTILRQLGGQSIKGDPKIKSVVGRIERPDAELYSLNITALLRFVQLVEQGEHPEINLDLGVLKGQISALRTLLHGERSEHPDFEQFHDLSDVIAWLTDEDIEWGEFEFTVKRLVKLQRSSKKLESVRDVDVSATLRWLETLTAAIENAEHKTSSAQSGRLLSTVHRVKGLQFDSVFIGDDYPELNPLRLGELKEQERWHVAYVAVTRAKLQLEHAFDYLESFPVPGLAEESDEARPEEKPVFGSESEQGRDSHAGAGLFQTTDFTVRVVGTSFRQTELANIARQFRTMTTERRLVAELRHDSKNPHDPNAVSVDIAGISVGFLPKEFAVVVAPLLAGTTFSCDAQLTGGHQTPRGPAFFGLTLAIGWRT